MSGEHVGCDGAMHGARTRTRICSIATAPVVAECEGVYEYIKSKNVLLWTIPAIDESNKSGAIEFEVPNGNSDHFFPVSLSFYSPQLFCPITVR